MDSKKFVELVKQIVADYANNGDKQELYVDAYKKWENFCVKV